MRHFSLDEHTLEYAFKLEQMFIDINEATKCKHRIKKIIDKDAAHHAGLSDQYCLRAENYSLICDLLGSLHRLDEMKAWYIRLCRYTYSYLLNATSITEKQFWGQRFHYACNRIANILESEDKAEDAKQIYEFFFSGKIFKHLKKTRQNKHRWLQELQDEWKKYGCDRLIDYYTEKGNYKKAQELLEWRLKN